MMRVTLNGHLLAESNDTIVVEDNHYFPPTSVRTTMLTPSDTASICPWKGTAAYYDAVISGKTTSKDVAWYYPNTTSDKAKPIEGYVAFYKNKVNIEEVPE